MKQTKKKEKLKVTSTKFSPNTKVEIIYVEICKNCRTPEYEKIIAREKLKQHRDKRSDEFSIDYMIPPKNNGLVKEKKVSFIKRVVEHLKNLIP